MDRYNFDELERYVTRILLAHHVCETQAGVIANCLITADACGIHTHGLSILSAHIDRITRGGYNLAQEPELTKAFSAFTKVDAKNTIGFYSACKCMDIAIEKSKTEGIHLVFANNCNTYGAAFYYTKMAADQGIIGITFCNSPAAMPAYRGMDKLLGTNPLAVGIPGLKKPPILFDMATSIAAKSKINEVRKNGGRIPRGWALDSNGHETTDPLEAIKGLILPMAGAKGYGMSLVIDILSGVLSGAAYLNHVNKFYSEDNSAMNVGQVFAAIDPRIVMGKEFYQKIDEYIDIIHSSKTLEKELVRLPGEKKTQSLEKSSVWGVELTEYTVRSLEILGQQCGIGHDFARGLVRG